MNSNQNAPAFAMKQGHIEAPEQLVWSILTDIAKWPEWNESLKKDSKSHSFLESSPG